MSIVKILQFSIVLGTFMAINPSLVMGQMNKDDAVTSGASAYQMVNPEIDDPSKPWSYSPKPTTVIGVPFVSTPVQVTFDGTMFTGNAELGFFYGKDASPKLMRQRTYLEGWIPIVQNKWQEGEIEYMVEFFGDRIAGLPENNPVQFAKVTVRNLTNKAAKTEITSFSRGCGMDHRYRNKVKYNDSTNFSMDDNCLYRNNALIYTFPEASKQFAASGVKYKMRFKAKKYQLNERSEVGLCAYQINLPANGEAKFVFKMPTFPIENKDQIRAVKEASYDTYREQTIRFWKEKIDSEVKFSFPEERVNNAYRASMVHLILATRNKEGSKRQGSGLPYDGLFLNDYVDMRLAYDFLGLTDFVDVNVPWLLNQQTDDGMFIDKSLTHGNPILASHGQALFSLAHHYLLYPDSEYLDKAWQAIVMGVEWIEQETNSNKYGLLRPSIPYDNEMIKGHYTSHNLWGIASLRAAIRVARQSNNLDYLEKWLKLHNDYLASVKKAIQSTKNAENYLPPGLYDYLTGELAGDGIKEYRTSQDWENNLLIYPSELLEKNDPVISSTLNHIRKTKYREGIMTYRNGMHLHQYITLNQAQQYLAINDQKKALIDFYHVMLHNGSVHEGFENLVEPWEDRDPHPSPSPHGWAAAKTVVFTRNMMVREYGGKLGLNENERMLHLYSLISPEWAKNGDSLSFSNVPTEFGEISSSLRFKESAATVQIQSNFRRKPKYIAIPIPYFKTLVEFSSDATESFVQENVLYLSPDVNAVTFTWENIPPQNNFQEILFAYRSEPNISWKAFEEIGNPVPANKHDKEDEIIVVPGGEGFLLDSEKNYPANHLSFELINEAFKVEYQRRYMQYVNAGKKPIITEAVLRETKKDRKRAFKKQRKKSLKE